MTTTNPGDARTIWINDTNGHAYRGDTTDLEDTGGDVSGPASSADNAVARFDTTTGKLLQNSGIILQDDDELSNVKGIDFTPQVSVISDTSTLWVNNSNGHLHRGTTDIEDKINATTGETGAFLRYTDTTGENVTSGGIHERGTRNFIMDNTSVPYTSTPTGSDNVYIGISSFSSIDDTASKYLYCYMSRIHFNVYNDDLTAAPKDLYIDSNNRIGVLPSTIRKKMNIVDLDQYINCTINDFRPVKFEYNENPGQIQFGLIAEEVNDVCPEIVFRNEDGEIESVSYRQMNIILLSELQKLRKEFDALTTRVTTLENGL